MEGGCSHSPFFCPVVGNLFHTTDGCQGEESIWMWLTARALFVCVRSHATIVELSIWVLSKICVMFQLQPHLALDAGKGDDHHGLSSGPRESICYQTSCCWSQGAVLMLFETIGYQKNGSRSLHCLFRFACPTSTPRWVRRPWWSSRRGLGRTRWPSSGALMA